MSTTTCVGATPPQQVDLAVPAEGRDHRGRQVLARPEPVDARRALVGRARRAHGDEAAAPSVSVTVNVIATAVAPAGDRLDPSTSPSRSCGPRRRPASRRRRAAVVDALRADGVERSGRGRPPPISRHVPGEPSSTHNHSCRSRPIELARLVGVGERDRSLATRAEADLGETTEELAAVGAGAAGEPDDTGAEGLLAPAGDADAWLPLPLAMPRRRCRRWRSRPLRIPSLFGAVGPASTVKLDATLAPV